MIKGADQQLELRRKTPDAGQNPQSKIQNGITQVLKTAANLFPTISQQ
jgi:hypothetical protein